MHYKAYATAKIPEATVYHRNPSLRKPIDKAAGDQPFLWVSTQTFESGLSGFGGSIEQCLSCQRCFHPKGIQSFPNSCALVQNVLNPHPVLSSRVEIWGLGKLRLVQDPNYTSWMMRRCCIDCPLAPPSRVQ
jgi:hypothetical protein